MHVKEKMKNYIKNLIKEDIGLHQVCSHFNACVLTNVFFGCGIVSFNKKKCEKLKKHVN